MHKKFSGWTSESTAQGMRVSSLPCMQIQGIRRSRSHKKGVRVDDAHDEPRYVCIHTYATQTQERTIDVSNGDRINNDDSIVAVSLVFLDDIIIFFSLFEQDKGHLRTVMALQENAEAFLRLSKSRLFYKEVY